MGTLLCCILVGSCSIPQTPHLFRREARKRTSGVLFVLSLPGLRLKGNDEFAADDLLLDLTGRLHNLLGHTSSLMSTSHTPAAIKPS